MSNIDFDEMDFDFLAEDEGDVVELPTYKLIIADDDKEVHMITEMALQSFEFEGRSLKIIHAYSGKETLKIMTENPDTAILLLDVVMEDTRSGLDVVDFLRNTLKNTMTRIILRTGQPGEAPKESVIREYEINDYLLKTELTIQKLYAALLTGLRSYRDLMQLETHKKGLEKIIETSANLFNHSTFNEFLTSILTEMSHFYKEQPSMIYLKHEQENQNGFVSIEKYKKTIIVAATGKYERFIGNTVESVQELSFINEWLNEKVSDMENIQYVDDGFIIRGGGNNQLSNFIFIEGDNKQYDFNLINLFLKNYSLALDNYILSNTISSTQQEMIFALGRVIESHFEGESEHVRRLSEMMYKFAGRNGFSFAECEILKVASTMHDVGKMNIDDVILKKPSELNEEEFEEIKTHAEKGYRILSKSHSDVLQVAAEIALNHHEKFDGTGYPYGKKGKLIPKSARMLAILDVFDALTHNRVYKGAISVDEAVAYIDENKGKHFDPELVECFIKNLDDIMVE
jgi:response regulator RpfG family c-di-GMP phosphodiesterase